MHLKAFKMPKLYPNPCPECPAERRPNVLLALPHFPIGYQNFVLNTKWQVLSGLINIILRAVKSSFKKIIVVYHIMLSTVAY